MEAIGLFALKATAIIILLIFLLLLSELGILKYLYEEIYTHPKLRKFQKFIGDFFADTLQVAGMSVVASVVFVALTTNGEFFYGTFAWGILSAIIGKYLKEK